MSRNRVETIGHDLSRLHWVCYAPTIFNPDPQNPVPVSPTVLRADLQPIRRFWDALVLYGSDYGLDRLPEIAASVDPPYRGIVIGCWRPDDAVERQAAARLARACLDIHGFSTVCLCAGNEGLFFGRYTTKELLVALEDLRRQLPEDVALTTTEPITEQGAYAVPDTLPIDYHLVTVHPFFTSIRARGPVYAARYVVDRVLELCSRTRLAVCVKETSWPSGGASDASPEAQLAFWRALRGSAPTSAKLTWADFEAYCAGDWKISHQGNPTETSYGWFDNPSRKPRLVASLLSPLTADNACI